MNSLRVLALAVTFAGCQYDYDKLYQHEVPDAGPMFTSDALISNWIGTVPSVKQECIDCAEANCAAENDACKADPTCVEYTKCVGKDPTPSGQIACRKTFSAWVNDPVAARDRDLNGPYGQCVFRYKCSDACAQDSELWCTGMYSMPTTSEQSVPMSLFLLDPLDQKPIVGASVRACAAQNPRECTDLMSNAMGVTDANGFVKLQLPASYSRAFTGYLEVTGGERYPTLLKFSWNVGAETTQVVSVVSAKQFQNAITGIFTTVDDTRGMLQLRMLGCQGAGVKGVHFALVPPDPTTRAWYIVNGVPKIGATETTPVGSGGIIDVPEGPVSVTAATANEAIIARVEAPVRAKFMTVVIYAPQGRQ